MPTTMKKKKKKSSGSGESSDGVLVNEPTMGEKLATLNLITDSKQQQQQIAATQPQPQPPSADSVQVLLRQALRADDRVLLLDCLYNRDEKVIAKSVSLLSPADVLKLLQSLISIIQSRGAILACALPWLKSLLLQHASGIMSQESSLVALNSLYQLIESRVSTFESAIQLSSCLDILYTGVVDDDIEENATTVPVIFEDEDESDEEKSEDAMETDQDINDEEASVAFDGVSDIEGSDGLSD
ncbi:hypothetical protein SO802_026536 [Lithocarpus litseifolius]|uniref:Small-subunit processome Utp12 domain-containing protein n=1 Tax=Lithocarpus litseifolius TaxID=425828 RepID=A0AAW2C045_9ROSI